MLKDQIIDSINKNIKNKELIKSLLLPAIAFSLEVPKSNELNLSRIGGKPLFQKDIDNLDLSLTFLAQISLNEIKDKNEILPKDGNLYFFLNTTLDNRFPDQKENFKILYCDEENLNYFKKENITSISNEYSLSFSEIYTFPSYQESLIEKSNIEDDEIENIENIIFQINSRITEGNYDVTHHILGHPQALQGTVRFWWAAKYLHLDKNEQYSKEEIKFIEQEEANFLLLLQLNFADPKIGLTNLGDSVAYFGIHKDDLVNKNFCNIKLVIQNT
ncbi:DUF1963 domain-containing protein [Chryseobacterium sp. KCF3-3]|uniref:DUF1963 domain-containing protein n=1 Tax=Chryseobacterium sp. KCF3-3 TaxID=3231511 RepID=UPI0038B3E95B